jgi:hypothetical protein
MGTLLTASNLPGIGDFDPPDDDELPACRGCNGEGSVWHDCEHGCDACAPVGLVWCPDCNGTGYQPEPDSEPDFGPEFDAPPYEGP